MQSVYRPDPFFGKIHFLLISENEFFHEINVTELRDGITSLHGIHVLVLVELIIVLIGHDA